MEFMNARRPAGTRAIARLFRVTAHFYNSSPPRYEFDTRGVGIGGRILFSGHLRVPAFATIKIACISMPAIFLFASRSETISAPSATMSLLQKYVSFSFLHAARLCYLPLTIRFRAPQRNAYTRMLSRHDIYALPTGRSARAVRRLAACISPG